MQEFMFANSVKIHICHIKNCEKVLIYLVQNDKVFLPFRRGFILCKVSRKLNPTKKFEFTDCFDKYLLDIIGLVGHSGEENRVFSWKKLFSFLKW